jgi:hypothetical protein
MAAAIVDLGHSQTAPRAGPQFCWPERCPLICKFGVKRRTAQALGRLVLSAIYLQYRLITPSEADDAHLRLLKLAEESGWFVVAEVKGLLWVPTVRVRR